jgi:hypothetical protein
MAKILCITCAKCGKDRPHRAYRHPLIENPVCRTCAFGPVTAGMNADGRNCTACHQWQGWDQFSPSQRGARGRSSHCKKCLALSQRWRNEQKKHNPLPV